MKFILLSCALVSWLAASGQTVPAFSMSCQEMHYAGQQQRFCETRDLTLPAPADQPLTIEGGTNGSISVQGWDGPDVRLRATIQTWNDTPAQAQAQAKLIQISTTHNTLRATAEQQPQAAVNFEVFVPRRTALALTTENGNISLTGLQATIHFHAQNGGVTLADVGGQVRGNTVNGPLTIRLSGSHWQGEGLDVTATNGPIAWYLPSAYAAQFFTSTDRGDITTMLPVTKQQNHHAEVSTTLRTGGQPVRAVTTNGPISIQQH